MFDRIRTRFNRLRRQRGWVPWAWVGAVAVAGGGVGTVWSVADWRIEQTDDQLMCGIEKDMLKVIGVKATPGARLATAATEQQACELLFDPSNVDRCPVFAPSAYARCFKLWKAATNAVPPQPAASAPARVLVTRVQDAPRMADTGVLSLIAGRVRELGHQHVPFMWGGGNCRRSGEAALRLITSANGNCLGVAIASDRFATAGHCANALDEVNVWCPGVADSKVAHGTCTSPQGPGTANGKEVLAVCSVQTTGVECLKELVQTARWNAPEAGLEPKPLYIMGVSAGALKVCPTTNEISWPPDNGSEYVLATIPNTSSLSVDFALDGGDSGGPVFDAEGEGRQVIGISAVSAEPGEPATIVPFYLWREHFAPQQPGAPE